MIISYERFHSSVSTMCSTSAVISLPLSSSLFLFLSLLVFYFPSSPLQMGTMTAEKQLCLLGPHLTLQNQTRLGKWCQSSVLWLIMLSMRVRPLKQKLGFNFGAFWPFKVLLREGIVSWWSSQFNLILSQWRFDDVSMVPCLWRWR